LTLANDTPASIKQAFRALARMLHPDKNPAPDASQRFQVMNSAYTRLCL
jgi:curved DNA-binding protein CbpA